MRIGIIGAGNIGQTLKAMLASVEDVTEITLADNAGQGDVHVDAGTGENLAAFVRAHDAIVNALPFYLNKTVASACAKRHADPHPRFLRMTGPIHGSSVSDLARDDKEIVFAPQCMRSGKLQQRSSSIQKVKAQELFPATAIQTMTAAGMAAVIELWTSGLLTPGFVRQEEIPFSVHEAEMGRSRVRLRDFARETCDADLRGFPAGC